MSNTTSGMSIDATNHKEHKDVVYEMDGSLVLGTWWGNDFLHHVMNSLAASSQNINQSMAKKIVEVHKGSFRLANGIFLTKEQAIDRVHRGLLERQQQQQQSKEQNLHPRNEPQTTMAVASEASMPLQENNGRLVHPTLPFASKLTDKQQKKRKASNTAASPPQPPLKIRFRLQRNIVRLRCPGMDPYAILLLERVVNNDASSKRNVLEALHQETKSQRLMRIGLAQRLQAARQRGMSSLEFTQKLLQFCGGNLTQHGPQATILPFTL